jgi:fatty acid desaturase
MSIVTPQATRSFQKTETSKVFSVPTASFSMREARNIVGDLFTPNPVIYWTDFLLTLFTGYAFFATVRRVDSVWLAGFSFVASCLLFYRASIFIHELTHLQRGTFKTFRVVWNLLCGIPFLVPSFLYYVHLDHHRRKLYGTEHDCEYLPLGSSPPWRILYYLSQSFIVPILAIVRFLIIAPICWVSPTARKWVLVHASSMVMNPAYARPTPTPQDIRVWRIQEALTFLFCAVMAGLLISGIRPLSFLLQAYGTGVFIVLLNEIRSMAAHRFYGDGRQLTFDEQIIDSINFPTHRFTSTLWAPVGLRFHALHHIFPTMPYHNLEKAHHRLVKQLPADSIYHQTVSPSLWAAARDLWCLARNSQRQSESDDSRAAA